MVVLSGIKRLEPVCDGQQGLGGTFPGWDPAPALCAERTGSRSTFPSRFLVCRMGLIVELRHRVVEAGLKDSWRKV